MWMLIASHSVAVAAAENADKVTIAKAFVLPAGAVASAASPIDVATFRANKVERTVRCKGAGPALTCTVVGGTTTVVEGYAQRDGALYLTLDGGPVVNIPGAPVDLQGLPEWW